MTNNQEQVSRLDTGVPHSARVWNYWLGGKDNFAADRAVGDQVRGIYPEVVGIARVSRAFLVRSVRYLAGVEGTQARGDAGDPYYLRSPDAIAQFFNGLDLLEPGVVSTPRWRPDPTDDHAELAVFCGVARKP